MKSALLVVLLVLDFAVAVQAEEPLAPATIVVFNSAVSESAQLAKFYAQKRGIARDHLVGLDCSREEEISREDYNRTIAEPLRAIFKKKRWWTLRESDDGSPTVASSSIRFVALIKGIPLKIRPAEKYPGDQKGGGPVYSRNEASVDSELALLGRGASVYGAVTNPYFQSYRGIMETTEAPLLVCRLDAPAAATVREMIEDAIAVEKTGLWGRAFVDEAHNSAAGYEMGDQWMKAIVSQVRKAGIPVISDEAPETFPVGYPVNDCALYYGWYATDVNGPFLDPLFRFVPGAIAVHIHSFSASTLRNPNAGWVGPLLSRGAAASLGNVYEPYLQLTSHLDILNDRLLHGFTLAESAYMSTQALSWMSVVVGDPLYRPYASWLQLDLKETAPKEKSDWKMYHDFAVENAGLSAPEYRKAGWELASKTGNAPMMEDLALLAQKDGDEAEASNHFREARAAYKGIADILRVVLEESASLVKQQKSKRAVSLLHSILRVVSGPTAALLQQMEHDLDPSVPAPTPKPTPSKPRFP